MSASTLLSKTYSNFRAQIYEIMAVALSLRGGASTSAARRDQLLTGFCESLGRLVERFVG